MLESYHKLQQKPKTVPSFHKLIWSTLLEKAIANAVKDHHKRLQTCVSHWRTFWTHNV